MNMKITRRQLRRLIKEELTALRETTVSWDTSDAELQAKLSGPGHEGWSLVVLKDLMGLPQNSVAGVPGMEDATLLRQTVDALAQGFPMYLGRPDLEELSTELQAAYERGVTDESILGPSISLPPGYGAPRPVPDDYDPVIVNERKKNARRRRKYRG